MEGRGEERTESAQNEHVYKRSAVNSVSGQCAARGVSMRCPSGPHTGQAAVVLASTHRDTCSPGDLSHPYGKQG